MFDLIFNKHDSLFCEKKLASSLGAPQENDTKFRFAIHPQGIIKQMCMTYKLSKHCTKSHYFPIICRKHWNNRAKLT